MSRNKAFKASGNDGNRNESEEVFFGEFKDGVQPSAAVRQLFYSLPKHAVDQPAGKLKIRSWGCGR
jgi:hypothetical protein